MDNRPPLTMMHESWQPPPELTGAVPRSFQWKGAGIANMALTPVLFFIGLGILGATWQSADEDHRLKQEGQVTDAIVTRTWSESGSRGSHYKVAYEFSVGGKGLKGESELSKRNWAGLQVGSHTPVIYVPGQLDYNRLSLAYETMRSYWVPLGVFAFWIFMLVLAVYPIRKERRLLKYGQAAPGMVTNTPAGRRPKYGYVIKYEFQLSDGTVLKGNTQRDRYYRNGDEVIILYDPKRPGRNDIYPTRLARIPS